MVGGWGLSARQPGAWSGKRAAIEADAGGREERWCAGAAGRGAQVLRGC